MRSRRAGKRSRRNRPLLAPGSRCRRQSYKEPIFPRVRRQVEWFSAGFQRQLVSWLVVAGRVRRRWWHDAPAMLLRPRAPLSAARDGGAPGGLGCCRQRNASVPSLDPSLGTTRSLITLVRRLGGSVAEWLTCWTQAQKGPGSNRKLFTPIVPLFTKQQNW